MSIQTSADTIAAKAASAAQWGGSAVAGVSGAVGTAAQARVVEQGPDLILGLTLNQWSAIGVIIGIFFAAAGFALSWFYKHQHLQLARERANGWSPLGDGE